MLVLAACNPTTSDPTSGEPSDSDPTATDTSTEPEPEPVNVPAVSLLTANAVNDVVNVTEGYVIYNNSLQSVAAVATEDGTVSLNYYNVADAGLKADYLAVTDGSYISLAGVVKTSTGGVPARSKFIEPTSLSLVLAPAWEFGSLLSAETVDMDTGFKAWANGIEVNDLGVVYTFTGVKFMTVGNALPADNSKYDYLNYSAVVAGKNEVGESTTNYFRLGIVCYAVPNTVNTTDTYTVKAFFVGTNKDIPWPSDQNPILRLTGYIEITPAVV
jgi:hypothetical protein